MIQPSNEQLSGILGDGAFAAWQALTDRIGALYEMDVLWSDNNKAGVYECKYRRGGKTLCALYVREGRFGFMFIFGAKERELFEPQRDRFSASLLALYDDAKTYHDGRWVMVEVDDAAQVDELVDILAIKRRPNRK